MTDHQRFGCVVALLLLTSANLRLASHGHTVPPPRDLGAFPIEIDGWTGENLPELTAREQQVLAADEYLLRGYRGGAGTNVVLFLAYYRSQRSGDALHSPRNCLPGAGWQPVSSNSVRIPNSASAGSSFEANHYVIEKDGLKQDVVYWYQAHGRMFGNEYLGKIYLAWDGITKGRTDGALIRITAMRTPVNDQSVSAILAFARDLTSVLPSFLPN
jgi:EpsI family protein